jgi:ribonuclease D
VSVDETQSGVHAEQAPVERADKPAVRPLEAGVDYDLRLIERAAELGSVIASASAADALAVDVEADGLFAHRPKPCTVQLAWREPSDAGAPRLVVAVIDALTVPLGPLAPLLGPEGPTKVLHDLTFDARLLGEAGAPLSRVRDTSVSARFLGHTSTGLASLLAAELGVSVDKRFQQHDWARRPLLPEQIRYLASDVVHLLELDQALATKAAALDISDEIAEECVYKLDIAGRPPRDVRPAYARIKGAGALDGVGRAVLRRLVEAREAVSARADVPPFKVIGNDVLLELARRRPTNAAGVAAVRGTNVGRAARHARAWLEAVTRGIEDGAIPEEDRVHFEPTRIDRTVAAARRAREAQISAWRRREAAARGVDEQAVLPGHCAQALLEVLVAGGDEAALRAGIAAVPGLGARRLQRYADVFVELARTPPATAPRTPPATSSADS